MNHEEVTADLLASKEFMERDLARSGLTAADMARVGRLELLPKSAHGRSAYRIWNTPQIYVDVVDPGNGGKGEEKWGQL